MGYGMAASILRAGHDTWGFDIVDAAMDRFREEGGQPGGIADVAGERGRARRVGGGAEVDHGGVGADVDHPHLVGRGGESPLDRLGEEDGLVDEVRAPVFGFVAPPIDLDHVEVALVSTTTHMASG